MKKMMIMVSAIMMAAAANAKSVETSPFNSVKLNVPSIVRVVYGDTYKVEAHTACPEDEKMLRITVEDGVLKIRMSREDNAEAKPMRITIVAPVDPELRTGRDLVMKPMKRIETTRDMANND